MERTKRATKARPSEDGARPGSGPVSPQALATAVCPHKSDGALRSELVPPGGRRLKPDEARAYAIDRVAAVVSRTCDWGEPIKDWHVGDYRFLVLEFSPTKRVSLYVQIWTEPEEPVLVEVCSGAWTPAARPFVRSPQRAALRALGYTAGGQARNFEKYWTLSPRADPRALADELLTVLIDVLGYRGRQSLGMNYCSMGRTVEDQVFPGLGTDDVTRMLRIGGCNVMAARPAAGTRPSVVKRLIHVVQPFPFAVEMRAQSTKAPATYDAMRFIAGLEGGMGVSSAQLEGMARQCPFGRIFRDTQGGLLLVYDLPVFGVTVRWFLFALDIWKRIGKCAMEMVQAALAARATDGPGTGGGPTDAGEPDDVDLDDDDGGKDEPRQSRTARAVVH